MCCWPLCAEPLDDPGALVPELPNACYGERDDFNDRAHAAMETLLDAAHAYLQKATQIFGQRWFSRRRYE